MSTAQTQTTGTEEPAGDSPLEGTEGADFSLAPPGGGEANVRPKRKYKPRGKPAPRVVEPPVADVPPDPMLVATLAGGVEAATALASKYLEFSEPDEKWKQTMAELSARWTMKLESKWLQEHPLEAQIMLHLSVYLVPNSLMLGGRMYVKYSTKKTTVTLAEKVGEQ